MPDAELTTEFDDRPLSELTMATALANRAETISDEPFLHYGPAERTHTYGELDRIANAIGNGLVDLDIALEDKVSVFVRSPLETVYAMFGIHKAGGVYAPINFDYKGHVLSYQLDDTDPSILIIEDQFIERLNAISDDLSTSPHVVIVETDAESDPLDDAFDSSSFAELKDGPTTAPELDDAWHNEASIVYTSGTTGRPKGVILPHRWIFSNYTRWSCVMMNQDDVVHTASPLYHVGGVYQYLTGSLVAGCSIALWDRFSPNEFWDRINKYGASRTGLLSVMMPWLMGQPERDDDHRNTLKWVNMQPLPENYEEIARRFGFDIVTVGFGQTESGVPIKGAIHAAPNGTPAELLKGYDPEAMIERAESIGIPVVDEVNKERWMGGAQTDIVDVAVMDENDERLPPGETGELAVRPKRAGLLLKEYYGKPDRTVEAFRNLWFHTGDAVYYDENGDYFFVDRIGDVIRRRGENISSLQIQDAINDHPDVAEAAVFPIMAPEGGEDQIGAAATPNDDAAPTVDEIIEYLTEELPEFMLPDRLEILEDLPTTQTNKIEKYKLRQRFDHEE